MLVLSLSGIYFWQIKHAQLDLHLKKTSFHYLPGWDEADTIESLRAFNVSCKIFLKQKPDTSVGSPYIPLTAADWIPACRAALLVDPASSHEAKAFFEHWFEPVEFFNRKPVQGLFTGYYLPLLHGSLNKTKRYHVPLYRTPNNAVTIDLGLFDSTLANRRWVGRLEGSKIVPFYTREEINQGVIANHASVIVWVDSEIDRLFLEIQGSGIVELEDGSRIYVGYASQNGAPYTAIGRVLIQKGVMTKENASMQGIRAYLESHPEEMTAVLNQNKSFIFFDKLPGDAAEGVQRIVLTPGYSLAVDRRWVPIGTPIWLNTTRPDPLNDHQIVLQRLMIAQDTGGAIRGEVRGDVFWGAGERATAIAGKMKNLGYYWLLLPKRGTSRSHQIHTNVNMHDIHAHMII